jgi:hypothetical protein
MMNTTTNNDEQADENERTENGLSWYRATELTNDLLREMISYYAREIGMEENKSAPDIDRIYQLERKQQEVMDINNSPASFASLQQMNKIIEVLSPLVKQLYAQP